MLERCLEENRQDVFVQNVVEMARPLAVALKMSGRARKEVRDKVKKKMLKMAKRAKTAKRALVCCAGSIATSLIHDYEEPEKWGGPYDCATNKCYEFVGWEGAKCYDCLISEAQEVMLDRKKYFSEEEIYEAMEEVEIRDEDEMARAEWESWVRDFQKEAYEWWKVKEREKVEER